MDRLLAYIDYYNGAYGDTIRIATQSKDWIMLLREYILDIMNGEIESFDFCKIPNIKCFTSIDRLELIKVKTGSMSCFAKAKKKFIDRPSITLTQIDGKNMFRWEQDVEELITLFCLIDELFNASTPGHQYLAGESDGCVIELSYDEDSPERFKELLSK